LEIVNSLINRLEDEEPIVPPIYKPIIINKAMIPYEIRRRFPPDGTRAEIKLRVDVESYPQIRVHSFYDNINQLEVRETDGDAIFSRGTADEYLIQFEQRTSNEPRDYILALEQDPTKGKNIFLFIYVSGEARG